jgi:hypothetical protein
MGTGVALITSLPKGRWLPAAGVLVLAAVQLQAHHSLGAEYDTSAPIELRGTISRVDWTNPHIFIHLDVTRPDRTHETWQVEADSPRSLHNAKLSHKMLSVGTAVRIKAFRANNGSTRAAGREIIFANGAKHSLERAPMSLTYSEWLRYSFPHLIRHWIPYVVMGMPVIVLIVGLFLLRSQGKKARTTA